MRAHGDSLCVLGDTVTTTVVDHLTVFDATGIEELDLSDAAGQVFASPMMAI